MNDQLKALELLKVIGKEDLFKDFINKNNGSLTKFINEAIEELETLEHKDRLAELEKVILDYYLAKGYEVGVGGWGFYVGIESDYKSKQLVVYFRRDAGSNYKQILNTATSTTKEMFNKAIEHFKIVDKEYL